MAAAQIMSIYLHHSGVELSPSIARCLSELDMALREWNAAFDADSQDIRERLDRLNRDWPSTKPTGVALDGGEEVDGG